MSRRLGSLTRSGFTSLGRSNAIYDIRNKRDVAHLGDAIDPNLQDATLVTANMDWVLAEVVRLHHNVSPDQAQAIIHDLVSREVPAIEEIDGQPVILSDLRPRDQASLLLYRAAGRPARRSTTSQLGSASLERTTSRRAWCAWTGTDLSWSTPVRGGSTSRQPVSRT